MAMYTARLKAEREGQQQLAIDRVHGGVFQAHLFERSPEWWIGYFVLYSECVLC